MVVVPSHSESFGLVAVEAQACGTPVLAANVGGLPVAVARRASPGSWWTVTSPMTGPRPCAGSSADDALRARLAAGARGHAETLSWDATVEGLLTSYSAALAAPRDALGRVG